MRWEPLIRAGWGGVLLSAPGAVLAATTGRDPAFTGAARVVLRVLGGRQLVQAGVELRWPRPQVLAVAAVVDGLHAASGFALAATDQAWRRPALLDAALALSFTFLTLRNARHQSRSQR